MLDEFVIVAVHIVLPQEVVHAEVEQVLLHCALQVWSKRIGRYDYSNGLNIESLMQRYIVFTKFLTMPCKSTIRNKIASRES